MPNTPCFFFFWLRVQVTSLNLIAFIISIESKTSLLVLAKSIYYPWYCSLCLYGRKCLRIDLLKIKCFVYYLVSLC